MHFDTVARTELLVNSEAIFLECGRWGSIAKSNFAGFRFRAPVYRIIRELALSHFEHYYNRRGERTLRAYSPLTPSVARWQPLRDRRMHATQTLSHCDYSIPHHFFERLAVGA
jgi:hypothetical protein